MVIELNEVFEPHTVVVHATGLLTVLVCLHLIEQRAVSLQKVVVVSVVRFPEVEIVSLQLAEVCGCGQVFQQRPMSDRFVHDAAPPLVGIDEQLEQLDGVVGVLLVDHFGLQTAADRPVV